MRREVTKPNPIVNEIISISPYSEKTTRIRVYAPDVADKCLPGQFVIVKFDVDGQRIPFSIIDYDRETGSIDFIIHRADGLDEILKKIKSGESLPDLLGPLGKPANIEEGKSILFFGDGSGVVPLLPLIQLAKKRDCHVKAVLSEHSSRVQCLLKEIEHDAETVVTVSDDDLLANAIKILSEGNIDMVMMSGPSLMMKRLAKETKERGVAAECILNMLMIDGIGLCGICRVIVGGERKQTCIDGPIFNAHLVDFDQLFNRQRLFV